MTDEQKIRWAIMAGQAVMLALLIPFALWLGTKLPAEEQPIAALYMLAGESK